jgi:hypothetical protein
VGWKNAGTVCNQAVFVFEFFRESGLKKPGKLTDFLLLL